MRPIPLSSLWLTFTALLLWSLHAAASPAELYQRSGMAQHQEHFQAALQRAQQRYAQQLPPAVQETLTRNSSQRFEPQGMHDRAQARLALAQQQADSEQARPFRDRPQGSKIVPAEARASSPASVAAMQQGLPAQQLSPARRAVVERLATRLPALELGVEVSMALTGLAAQSANDLLGGLMKLPQQDGSGGRERLRAQMRPDLPDTLAYIYRELSDDELTRFAEWTESAAGQAFYRATEQAVRDALNP